MRVGSVEKVKRMTLAEKAALVNGDTPFGTKALSRHGLEKLLFLDGGTGMNFEQLFGEFAARDEMNQKTVGGMTENSGLRHVIEDYYHVDKLTKEEQVLRERMAECLRELTGDEQPPGCFPSGILLGSTWCKETVYHVGQALGMEALHFGVNLLLGSPYVNLMRDPLNGRLFESYSEDPCLMSCLAPELVKGVQEYGVAANVKHFAANNQETYRVGVDEMISRRALEELYFPAFKACVEAGAATVMSAYNSINGIPCTENHWLLTEKLRDEWGFEGLVVSDWGAVYHPAAAVEAGNDIAMPGPLPAQPIIEAVEQGTLSEEALDTSVKRILDFYEHWGPETQADKRKKYTLSDTDRAAFEAVREGAVLLKNENAIFPLQGSVSLFGQGALGFYDCGTGSAGITTSRTTSLLEELKKCMGEQLVTYEEDEGCGDTYLVVARQLGMEGNDRKSLALPEEELINIHETIRKAKKSGKKVGVILNVCGPVDCRSFIDDIDGLFCVFLPGMQGAKALARLLVGEDNPSGRLTVTFPYRYEDTPTYLNFPGDGKHAIYGEDIFVGYRYYDTKDIPVLFPFGYGLSYTTFECSNVQTSADRFTEELYVTADVTNTGNVAGKEVVSLYVHDEISTLRKPVLELKAFEKVYIEPGETVKVQFHITRQMLASFDMDLGSFEAEEGYYDFCVLTAQTDRRELCSCLREMKKTDYTQTSVEGVSWPSCVKRVYGSWKSAYTYSLDTGIKELYEGDSLRPLLFELFKALGLDEGIIYSNYQYTSYKTLRTVLLEAGVELEAAKKPGAVLEFENQLQGLIRE